MRAIFLATESKIQILHNDLIYEVLRENVLVICTKSSEIPWDVSKMIYNSLVSLDNRFLSYKMIYFSLKRWIILVLHTRWYLFLLEDDMHIIHNITGITVYIYRVPQEILDITSKISWIWCAAPSRRNKPLPGQIW